MNELAAFLRRPDIAAEMEDDLRTLVAVPSVGAPGEGGYPFGPACAAVLDAALTNDSEMLADAARLALMAEAMKYAIIFIASAPLLIAYPFDPAQPN